VGILTETPGLYDRLSAWQNLLYFGELYNLGRARASTQTERYLRLLDLWERRDDPVSGFSAIALAVAISSRVNDPRTAQQLAAIVVVPVLAWVFARASGALVLSPALALAAGGVLALASALAFYGVTRLFHRAAILTPWR
jgi:hypothetical protein